MRCRESRLERVGGVTSVRGVCPEEIQLPCGVCAAVSAASVIAWFSTAAFSLFLHPGRGRHGGVCMSGARRGRFLEVGRGGCGRRRKESHELARLERAGALELRGKWTATGGWGPAGRESLSA